MGMYKTRWECYRDSKKPAYYHERIMVILRKDYADRLGITKTDRTVEVYYDEVQDAIIIKKSR